MKFSNRDARFRIDFRVTENADARATPTEDCLGGRGREKETGDDNDNDDGDGDGEEEQDEESMRAARMIMEKLRRGKADGDEHRSEWTH